MTSIAVDPDARVIRLTDPELSHYPFLFMVHVEGIVLDDAEVVALRNHFQRGGTLMVTDFWGTDAWDHFKRQIGAVMPEHDWVKLTMDHPVFHSIFHIEGPMHMLRVPTMQFWNTRADRRDPRSEISVRYRGAGSEEMNVWALLDDRERIMAIALHNSDVSDGWERESENEAYFKEFSEPVSYPLALNIIFYLMTH